MHANTATKLSPIIYDCKKLEVSLDNDKTSIKLSTWTENLGWCGQKTLQVDVEMLNDLHRLIATARYKANEKQTEKEIPNRNKVIEFPIA